MAVDMLQESDIRVIAIAMNLGYENQQNFGRAFKKSCGMIREFTEKRKFVKRVEGPLYHTSHTGTHCLRQGAFGLQSVA